MRQPSRRAVIGAALGLGTGGCLGTVGDTTGVEPVPLGTEQRLDGSSVTVSDVAVRDSVLYFETPESMVVADREDERYVVASIIGESSGPSPASFGLLVDDERYKRPDSGVDFGRGVRGWDAPYDPDGGQTTGRLTFLTPISVEASEAHIVAEKSGETVGWELDEQSLTRLARGRPTFELAEVDAPETVVVGESASVRLRVENVSSVPGVFRGVFTTVGLGGGSYPLELPVEPGATTDWEQTFERVPDGAAGEAQFVLDSVIAGRQVVATTTVKNATTQVAEGS